PCRRDGPGDPQSAGHRTQAKALARAGGLRVRHRRGSAGIRAPGSRAARGRYAPRVEQCPRCAAGSKAGCMSALFAKELSVLNLGIAGFADAIKSRGGAATQLDWAPPAAGDRAAGEALASVVNEPKIEAANVQAVERYL